MAQSFAVKTLKQFGGSASAGSGGIAEFGSLKAGSAVYSTDPDTIQSLAAWAYGWANAVITGNNAPALEDMNAVMFVLSYMLMYNQQEGVTEWNAGVTYNTGSIVKTPYTGTANSQGLYISLQDANLNQSLPGIQANNSYWAYLGGGENDGFVPTGMVFDYAGSSAPLGYLMCDGTVVAQATYPALYNVIGATFNVGGEGAGNFRLPNALGRVTVGAGAGAGLTNRVLAATGGEETHTLITSEMPSHNHPNTQNLVYGAVNGNYGWADLTTYNTENLPTGYTGGDGAHNNMQPFLVVNKIIKT